MREETEIRAAADGAADSAADAARGLSRRPLTRIAVERRGGEVWAVGGGQGKG